MPERPDSPEAASRWEIQVLIGPCTHEEAEALLIEIAEQMEGRLGACCSMSSWEESDG